MVTWLEPEISNVDPSAVLISRAPFPLSSKALSPLRRKRLLDPVGGVLFQVENDVNRLAGLAGIAGRFGNRSQRLGKSSVGIWRALDEIRHLENGGLGGGLDLRATSTAVQEGKCRDGRVCQHHQSATAKQKHP
jgi:hypothetical protein